MAGSTQDHMAGGACVPTRYLADLLHCRTAHVYAGMRGQSPKRQLLLCPVCLPVCGVLAASLRPHATHALSVQEGRSHMHMHMHTMPMRMHNMYMYMYMYMLLYMYLQQHNNKHTCQHIIHVIQTCTSTCNMCTCISCRCTHGAWCLVLLLGTCGYSKFKQASSKYTAVYRYRYNEHDAHVHVYVWT